MDYILSLSGKTTIIAEIAQKYRSDGVLIVVPTIDAAEDLRSQLQPIGTYILHSGELSSDRLLNYRNDPDSLRDFDVLVITSARFQLDPIPLFTAHRNGCRGLILVDELINFYPEQPVDPMELKNVLTYIDGQPGISGKLIDPDNKLYQHIYQDMDMMKAAYKCSGLNLMKLGNNLEQSIVWPVAPIQEFFPLLVQNTAVISPSLNFRFLSPERV